MGMGKLNDALYYMFWGSTKKLNFGLQKEILEHTVNVTFLF